MTTIIQALGAAVLLCGVGYFIALALQLRRTQTLQLARFDSDRAQWDLELETAKRVQEAKVAQTSAGWSGLRRFEIKRKEMENPSGTICSFYLFPHDEAALKPFKPGQFLTFNLSVDGQEQEVVRCYSLSDRPRDDYYRVSIREVEGGLSSTHFHRNLQEGDLLQLRAPAGEFYIDLQQSRPIVMIAGGVGITPFLSMVAGIAKESPGREGWLFYAAQNKADLIQIDELRRQVSQARNLHLIVCLSDAKGESLPDGWVKGRIDKDLLARTLPSLNYEFYMCGPLPMMESLETQLQSCGVPKQSIHYENFVPPQPDTSGAAVAEGTMVHFKRSGKSVAWDAKHGSLQRFAAAQGVKIPLGCGAGNCGTCRTAVREGEVDYFGSATFSDLREGECLPCICCPVADLELDV